MLFGNFDRQSGASFAGQHYTLFRHYDPVLMRFTGPDPAAAEFWNLNSYTGNSPAAFYDPDGLEKEKYEKPWLTGVLHDWFFNAPDKLRETFVDPITDRIDGAKAHGFTGFLYGKKAIDHYNYKAELHGWNHNGLDRQAALFGYAAGDALGVTDLADAIEGRDTWTGRELSAGERWLKAGFGTLKYFGAASVVSMGASASFSRMSATPLMRGPAVPIKPRVVPTPRLLRGSIDLNYVSKLKQIRSVERAKLPYLKSRPSYAKGQVEDVWEAAKQLDGNVYDPNTGALLSWNKSTSRAGQWDMGHRAGLEYAELHRRYRLGTMSKSDFLGHYRDARNYQPEGVGPNRSRRYQHKS